MPHRISTPIGSSPKTCIWLRIASAIAGAALLIDAVALMFFGMFNVGVTVPAALGILLIVTAFKSRAISLFLNNHRNLRAFWRLGWCVLGLWALSVLVFWWHLVSVQSSTKATNEPISAIVVLGSATRDGAPSQALALRLDVAAELAKLQPNALIITSGGVDFGQTLSEGRVMANYLVGRHGIPQERVVAEEQSTSTALNLSLSKAVLEQRGVSVGDSSIAVVTSDFHTLRAGKIASKAGYAKVVTVGAPTPLSIRFNAWLREYFAVASSWLLREF